MALCVLFGGVCGRRLAGRIGQHCIFAQEYGHDAARPCRCRDRSALNHPTRECQCRPAQDNDVALGLLPARPAVESPRIREWRRVRELPRRRGWV